MAQAAYAAMDEWADQVVAAWLDRRDGEYERELPHFGIYLCADVAERSIGWGECFVTRWRDGFFALVNGKRFRGANRDRIQLLQGALLRRNVLGVVVPPPHAWSFVTAEDLDRWYQAARVWQALEPRAHMERLIAIAEPLVAALVAGERAQRYADGYYFAEADGQCIAAGPDCIVMRPAMEPRPYLLSARRYRCGSFVRGMREAARFVLQGYGIRPLEVLPTGRGCTSPVDLWNAWQTMPRLKLED